jgi:hypothetical protein
MIYSIIIYRDNDMIHTEWINRSSEDMSSLPSFSPKSSVKSSHSEKLVVGMLSAICGIVSMLSPDDIGNKFECFITPGYRLDYYETQTRYRFVVISEPDPTISISEVRGEFEKLYNLLFIPLVLRNPLFHPRALTGDLRESHCHAFVDELRTHFQSFSRGFSSSQITYAGSPQVPQITST